MATPRTRRAAQTCGSDDILITIKQMSCNSKQHLLIMIMITMMIMMMIIIRVVVIFCVKTFLITLLPTDR